MESQCTKLGYGLKVGAIVPNHGLHDNILIQYFYRSLDTVDKGVVDNLSPWGLMQQPYTVATQLLDGMTTINIVWYTHEDEFSLVTF